MKKIYLLMATIILILSGCGGGGGNDAEDNGPPPTAKIDTSVVSFENDSSGNEFSAIVKMTAAQMAQDIKIELDGLSLSLNNGCTVDSYTIENVSGEDLRFEAVGESHNININAKYSCPGSKRVISTAVELSYDKWILNGNNSERRGPYKEVVNLAQTGASGDTQSASSYKLYAQESLTVKSSQEHYQISVALSVTDINGTHPAVGEKIVASFIQPLYGSLQSYSVTTDESGMATFTYVPPKEMKGLSESLITFYKEGEPSNMSETKLIFEPQLDKGVANLYIMPQNIQVSKAGEEQKIKFITVNSENVGISAEVEVEQLFNGDGNDYGEFSTTTIKTNDSGIGELTYKAPDSIDNQPTRVITATEKQSNIQKEMTFNFFSTGDGVATYEIEASAPKTIAVEQEGVILVSIHEKGAPDKLIDSERVKNVTVDISGFKNMLSFTKVDDNKFSYSQENVMSIGIKTKTIAGVALVQIEATIFNGKEDVKLKTAAPLTIMSGPISSLSLVYVKTIPDEQKGLFKDIYTVHAVDKYANHANKGDKIHPSLISGGTEGNSTEAATIMPDGADTGAIEHSGGVSTFTDSTRKPFGNLNPARDRVIVLASNSHSGKEYMGHWSIEDISSSESLTLKETYYGSKIKTGLKYVVGDEDRLLNGNVATADVVGSADNPDYTIDDNGTAQIEVVYDPAFVGHTYTIAVNSYTSKSRSGAAIINNFRGNGYVCNDVTVPANGDTQDAVLAIAILNPNGGTVWLDNVDITAQSLSAEPKKQCSIDFDNSNLHVKSGHVLVKVNTTAGTSDTCTIHWAAGNGSILMEYY
jgi:hypothetical protein